MRVNQRSVRTRCVGVRGNRVRRHEGQSSLEQSIKSTTILQVVSRKVAVLENALRLDVVGFQDVTKESREVRLGGIILATRGGRASWSAGLGANKTASIATG